MNVAFLGLGGNLGDRYLNLRAALQDIEKNCGEIMLRSSVYETEAWGFDSANSYLNVVVKIQTDLSALALIERLQALELQHGRMRTHERNSDRVIDIDLLFFNNDIFSSAILEVPHPRLHLRKFVLVPLCEIAKELWHPGLNKHAEQLLAECEDDLKVVRYQ